MLNSDIIFNKYEFLDDIAISHNNSFEMILSIKASKPKNLYLLPADGKEFNWQFKKLRLQTFLLGV